MPVAAGAVCCHWRGLRVAVARLALIGTPTWVLGSTDAPTGLGITVNVNAGTGGGANGIAGTIEATVLGLTAPTGQTVTFDGSNFTNVIPPIVQTGSSPSVNITLGGNNLVLDGGTLQFTSDGATFGPANTFALTSNGGKIDTQGFSDTISSQITGTGGLMINGTNTSVLTLTHANTYTGGTTLNAGTLVIANGQALGAVNSTEQSSPKMPVLYWRPTTT